MRRFAFLLTVTVCAIAGYSYMTRLTPSKSLSAPDRTFYIALEANSEEEKLSSQDVLHELSKTIESKPQIIVDELKGETVTNLFSDKTSPRHAFREAIGQIQVVHSENGAIVSAITRAVLLGQEKPFVSAVIVTSGTVDPFTLTRIKEVSRELNKETTKLYFLGISEEIRLPMSQAFSEIKGNVRFSSTDSEMLGTVSRLNKE